MYKQAIPSHDVDRTEDGGIHVEWPSGQLRKFRVLLIVNTTKQLTAVVSSKLRRYRPTPLYVTP